LTFSDFGKFLCNICGAENECPGEGFSREGAGCSVCHSSMRIRALIALLSEEMLGIPMTLAEFPVLKGIRGIGMSDYPELAERLSEKFDYTNTFYHQPPEFDVTRPDPADYGRYDFIISTEVMEHVPPPVEKSFENLLRLLKPEGLLIMTTPYTLGGKTREHFPDLHEFTLATLGGKTVLVNRRRDGSVEVFEDLVFHGGPGSTVEMRVFTDESLHENMLGVGFSSVRIASEDVPEFGVHHAESWSLPIVARKGHFHPPAMELAREYRGANQLAIRLRGDLERLQSEYESFAAHHRKWYADVSVQLAERHEWGTNLHRELTERTEWAQTLDAEVAELRARLERETAALRGRLEEAQGGLARMSQRKWTRLGRKLGLLDR
jgi:SAM-dependent methyltransferase